jgi:hypothetical protein
MPASDDLYEILQVSPSAEPEVIEAAYRRLARKYHPDVSPLPGSAMRMQQIVAAYEILGDTTRRAAYDRAHPWLSETGAARSRGSGRRRDLEIARMLSWVCLAVLVILFVALPPVRIVLARGLPLAAVLLLLLWLAWWGWRRAHF